MGNAYYFKLEKYPEEAIIAFKKCVALKPDGIGAIAYSRMGDVYY